MSFWSRFVGTKQAPPQPGQPDSPARLRQEAHIESAPRPSAPAKSPLMRFDPAAYVRQQESRRGLRYGHHGTESYKGLVSALQSVPGLRFDDPRLPSTINKRQKTFAGMVDDVDFFVGQSAAQGQAVSAEVKHGIFVYLSTGMEVAKLDEDSYLIWNFDHDPQARAATSVSSARPIATQPTGLTPSSKIQTTNVMKCDTCGFMNQDWAAQPSQRQRKRKCKKCGRSLSKQAPLKGPLQSLEAVAPRPAAYSASSMSIHRGGVGEPYCSERCSNAAGKDISLANLHGYDGPCGFCQRPLHLGLGSGNFAHPFRKIFLYICPGCRSKAEAHAAKIQECCFCGGSLA